MTVPWMHFWTSQLAVIPCSPSPVRLLSVQLEHMQHACIYENSICGQMCCRMICQAAMVWPTPVTSFPHVPGTRSGSATTQFCTSLRVSYSALHKGGAGCGISLADINSDVSANPLPPAAVWSYAMSLPVGLVVLPVFDLKKCYVYNAKPALIVHDS